MKVGTQQGNHQLGKSTKALTNQGHRIDDITFITFIISALDHNQKFVTFGILKFDIFYKKEHKYRLHSTF